MKKDIKLMNNKRFYFNNVKVFGRGGNMCDSINTHNTLSEDVLKEIKDLGLFEISINGMIFLVDKNKEVKTDEWCFEMHSRISCNKHRTCNH